MTFEEFQKTCKHTASIGDAVRDDCYVDDQGCIYLGALFLIDTINWKDRHPSVKRWFTVIGNMEFVDDNIEVIEKILYQFAKDEGYIEKEVTNPTPLEEV